MQEASTQDVKELSANAKVIFSLAPEQARQAPFEAGPAVATRRHQS
jgi:hypothetical protein